MFENETREKGTSISNECNHNGEWICGYIILPSLYLRLLLSCHDQTYRKKNKYKDLFLITIVAKSKEVDDIKTKRGTMNNLQSFKKITHRLSYGNGPLKLSWFGLFPSCVLYGTILTSSASCSFGLMTSPTDSQAPMTLPGRGEGKGRTGRRRRGGRKKKEREG